MSRPEVEVPEFGSEKASAVGTVLPVRVLSLRRNFSWTLAGNLTYAGCQWGLLVALAKLGNPEMVGQFALALAITSPVFMFASFNLRAVQATDARDTFEFGDYLALRLLSGFAACLLTAVIALASGYSFAVLAVILAIACAKGLESFSDTIYGFFQKHEAMNLIGKSQILKGFALLLLSVPVMYATGSLFAFCLAMGAGSLLVLTLYDRGNLIRMNPAMCSHRPRTARMAELARLSMPLGLVMMMNSLNTNVPRYVLERFFDEYELGIFAAMAYLMVTGTTVIAALGQSASPRLAKYYAAGDFQAFRRLVWILAAIAVFLGGGGFLVAKLFGRWLLSALYTEEYAAYAREFSWVMVASGMAYLSSVLGYAITASRRFVIQVPVTVVSLVASLLASLLLIPKLGILGAVLTTMIVFASQLPLKVWILFRALRP